MSLKSQTTNFLQKKVDALEMGGVEAIQKQHAQGKLTVRERIDLLFDPGTFCELGGLAQAERTPPPGPLPQGEGGDKSGKKTPADGVVTGHGLINGRRASVIAYDFTVIAGTIGEVGERKAQKIREMALTERIPIIWLLDSAGARVQEIASSKFAMTGKLFFDQVMLSGVVPQVAAMMGPCAAGTAYIAGLADFVPMVKRTSSMALAGPPLVEAAIGEKISVEDLGGSKIHCEVSGVGDLEVSDDKACLEVVKKYLSYLPAHCSERPPVVQKTVSRDQSDRLSRLLTGGSQHEERLDDDILEILPDDSKKIYDMKKIILKIVDGADFFEIKPKFGQGIITGFARIGGSSIGIVANQPSVMGGVIQIDESDKAARFVNICNAYNIPLLFLQDCPGFMVGSQVEKAGIIRHGAKMLWAVSHATVPKITIIIRKAFGAGYYVMCGKAYGPDLIVAWPSAEISLMGAEGAVNIIFRKEIEGAGDPAKKRGELTALYRDRISLSMAAEGAYIDDVIDPRDTRRVILSTLRLTENKRVVLPERRNGVVPV